MNPEGWVDPAYQPFPKPPGARAAGPLPEPQEPEPVDAPEPLPVAAETAPEPEAPEPAFEPTDEPTAGPATEYELSAEYADRSAHETLIFLARTVADKDPGWTWQKRLGVATIAHAWATLAVARAAREAQATPPTAYRVTPSGLKPIGLERP